MINSYPADIRNWILSQGGAARLPGGDYLKLPAWMLWEMGYSKCSD
jgi:hypothetical protein